MSYPGDRPSSGRDMDEIVRATRRSISERLSDPYLTEHDRMVLRQFGRFLSGITPEPDRRVAATIACDDAMSGALSAHDRGPIGQRRQPRYRRP